MTPCQVKFSTTCRCSGSTNATRHETLHRCEWRNDRGWAAVDEDSPPATCASPWGASRRSYRRSTATADEWNTAALGPTKRARRRLLFRLKRRYGADGFVHMGQGKWYPGEQLPRWTIGCYWRADGEPAWTDACLFADEQHPDGHGVADAERFITALAARLDVTAAGVQAAYEDVLYYLWRERKLPVNVGIRSTRAWTTNWNATACGTCSHKVSPPSLATRCRFGGWANAMDTGRPGRGSCATSGSI